MFYQWCGISVEFGLRHDRREERFGRKVVQQFETVHELVRAYSLPDFCQRAAPFVPDDDAQVLERLPDRSAPQYRDLKRLQAAVVAAPNDVAAATALAEGYYRISRREGDPRFLGYAQAALTTWWKDPEAPTAGYSRPVAASHW